MRLNLEFMKKIITFLSILLLTILLLPSCGVTLVKRQHSPGYYVNTNPRHPAIKSDKSQLRLEKPTNETAETATKPEGVNSSIVTVAEQSSAPVISDDASTIQPPVSTTEQEIIPTELPTAKTKKVNKVVPLVEKVSDRIPMVKKMNTKLNQSKAAQRSSSGEGLSLIWIVILVLLILWAAGLLSGGWGLGGLIYILLVIALILLILWLLRII